MLRKLQGEVDAYDTTCLVLAEWADPPASEGVTIRDDLVPLDLGVDRFLATLIEKVLDRTPIDMHVRVREVREHRQIPIEEAGDAGEADATL